MLHTDTKTHHLPSFEMKHWVYMWTNILEENLTMTLYNIHREHLSLGSGKNYREKMLYDRQKLDKKPKQTNKPQNILVTYSKYFVTGNSKQSSFSNDEIKLFIKSHIAVQGWSRDKSLRENNLSFSLKQAKQFSFE